MLRRMRLWLSRRRRPQDAPAAHEEERASGTDALDSSAQAAAEAAPGGQPRVKTDRL
jgi:hypothetical protein